MVTLKLKVVVVKIKYIVQVMELIKITRRNSPFCRSEVFWFGLVWCLFNIYCEDVYTGYITCMAGITIPSNFKSWTLR